VIRAWLPAAALALALAPLAALHPVRIEGRSMEPLLHSGELRLALRAWCAGPPRTGQVWLLATPSGTAVKRLVAPPGSHVEIRDGELWIDGRYVPEPFLTRTDRASAGRWETGPGWFALGDNRPDSYDSRAWGPVAGERLEGRVLGTGN